MYGSSGSRYMNLYNVFIIKFQKSIWHDNINETKAYQQTKNECLTVLSPIVSSSNLYVHGKRLKPSTV
jgi:hypothetical protein